MCGKLKQSHRHRNDPFPAEEKLAQWQIDVSLALSISVAPTIPIEDPCPTDSMLGAFDISSPVRARHTTDIGPEASSSSLRATKSGICDGARQELDMQL